MQLSIIIPIYNEEANIVTLHRRLDALVKTMKLSEYEFIFINDGSRDRSIQLVKGLAETDKAIKYIDFSRNFGHQIAVTAGLDHAKGNRIAIIDADLQDPPELIIEMFAKMDEGFEVVYAKRRRRSGESFMKLLTAKVFYRLLARITSVEIPVDTGDFRVIDRKVLEILKKMPEQNKYLRGQIAWIGFRQTYVEYDRSERAGGQTGYTYSKMIRFALDGITSFSDFPLKMATMAGFTVSGFAFLLLLYVLYTRLISGDYVEGWASTIISVLFLGGIQLISLGIIGEYLSRLGANIRNRPLYIVNETNTDK
ncbi:dolichol-phosphate mannosyltransferase [Flexibacter flexilis DSM 6793]|uniref:Dolichol-phosphate mannosyltransferase n=1 Tax=Flexibacter flexilis DSM 6793 TaxID=927664 RepID=A0A1I1FP28_9BACT|nr:glycosyltransferase family 2 protein [Flexibacter flexilis]SFC01064.1 dolichol-phosphate mannosyltransferase [Flexibacter flexilis DSM 6793]